MVLYALWFIALKRFLYLWKIGTFKDYHGSIYYVGWLYIVLSLITVIIKVSIGIPNLYNARLWETYPWTTPLADINGNVYLFLNLGCPVIIYSVITKDLKTVTLTINRTKSGYKPS